MSFSHLHPDVQRYVAGLVPTKENRYLTLTSKKVRANLQAKYLERICGIPVQFSEFVKYLEEGPRKIGNLALTPVSAEAYVRSRDGPDYRTVLRCIAQRGNINCFNSNDYFSADRVHKVFTSRGYDANIYDLYTTGNILLRRTGCVAPDYVKNRLFSILAVMEPLPNDDVPTQIRKNLFIFMNAEIFEVPRNISSIRQAITRWLG